jgi:hypothetical protein
VAEQILLSPLRITAFIQFLRYAKKAPQTIKNKMHHVVAGVATLKDRKDMRKLYHHLRRVKQIAKETARQCAKAIPGRTASKADEIEMINAGKFFYEEEKSVFLEWLLISEYHSFSVHNISHLLKKNLTFFFFFFRMELEFAKHYGRANSINN